MEHEETEEQIEHESAEERKSELNDDWDFKPEQADPLEALRQEIADLKAIAAAKDAEPDWKADFQKQVVETVMGAIRPALDAMAKPNEVNAVVDIACQGLGDDAKAYVRDYLSAYTAEQLKALRNEKPTLEVLRNAAKAVSAKPTKTTAPRSESSTQSADDALTADDMASISLQAQILYNNGVANSVEQAKKILVEEWKKEKRNA